MLLSMWLRAAVAIPDCRCLLRLRCLTHDNQLLMDLMDSLVVGEL